MHDSLKKTYNSVMEKCGDLTDSIDWSTMRKRQLYNNLDPEIQSSIDNFYEFCMSKDCPYYGGKKRYIIMTSLMIEMYFIMNVLTMNGLIYLY